MRLFGIQQLSRSVLADQRKQRNVQKAALQAMDYDSWTKEALVERVRQLEHQKAIKPRWGNGKKNTSSGNTSGSDMSSLEPKRKKQRKPDFDFSRFPQRKVALKFSYFGWPYHGLARQGNALSDEEKKRVEEQYPTIEGELFKALAQCKLIVNEAQCGYSRCGRTDRGVSGFGQVVAMYVRSNGRFLADGEMAEGAMEDEHNGRRYVVPENERELPYVSMLNKSLPQEIRVLAWAPVAEDFDARFSCRARFYRYFFNEAGLDVALMRAAAQRYLGTHDFRNFCRLDPAKQIGNFERTVLAIDITPVPQAVPFIGDAQAGEGRWWQLELRGSAFLWHQVRCMMAILFHIGQGFESPEIIDQMMDVQTMSGKPEYEMAADTPLVLTDCRFDADAVEWIYVRCARDYGNMTVLDRTVLRQWEQMTTQSVISGALLQILRTTQVPVVSGTQVVQAAVPWDQQRAAIRKRFEDEGAGQALLGGGTVKHMRKYVPIATRNRADPVEDRNRAWLARKMAHRAAREGANAGGNVGEEQQEDASGGDASRSAAEA
ncbi:pseudouridine synthase deg1 [Kickxella alabastrina]|uniref:Pseudouridine synthase deg1 n=1 Tax=Kickxella alabastrina TaxID=61397 RepID=A0ACC1IBS0_9FUNG|nr:pseudouridine synthase deg1 [Kickxella alabastrina]